MNEYSSASGRDGQTVRSSSTSSARNGVPLSASTLLDPKRMKQQMTNGISSASSLISSRFRVRRGSEPPLSQSFLHDLDFGSHRSKDDAHTYVEGRGKTLASSNAIAPVQQSSFNAKQLLDPKGFRQKPRTERGDDGSLSDHAKRGSSNGVGHQDAEETEGQGIGGMIERIHGVSTRKERPSKRQKIDHDNEKTATFTGGTTKGEIGEYLEQKRKEGQSESALEPNKVVDLTGGDDEDLVIISDSQEKEVCYGRLEATKVVAHAVPDPGNKANYLSRNEWPAMKLLLRRFPGNDNIIRVLDPTAKDFGNIDVKTSQGLSKIMDSKNPKYRVQARLMNRKRKENQYPGAPCSEYLDLIINIYGPRNKADSIGRFLRTKMLRLLTPYSVEAGKEICNPHAPMVDRNNTLPRTSHVVSSNTSIGFVSRTTEEIRSDVLGMFDSLQKSESLPEMEADGHIVTPLLGHQKQALHFMVSKEQERVFGDNEEDNNSLWRLRIRPNGQRTYYNVITGQEEHQKPSEVLGGILADMMGLGKTLSILSLIVQSLPDAREFSTQPPPAEANDEIPLARNSKATLLVSPLSTVANWEEQIRTHIQCGALSHYVYHGSNRCKDLAVLSKFDLVITTYQIVSSEASGRGCKKGDASPLLQTNFFRIVLDEAHSIREQSTRQSQAICAISAQRRWAVTGTPVQNRLDDLGALIKFLRMKPFSERGGFNQYILSPFKMADPEILPKLRLLVDSITLRRLKDRIDLPGRQDEIVRLKFSEDEEVLYEWFAKDSDRRMKIIASEQKKSLGGKTYVHILRAIMRLRLICAHGRELLSEDDLKLTEGFSMNNAIDLDGDEDEDKKLFTNARQAYEMLMLFRETDADTCCQCAKIIKPDLEVAAPGKDQTIGYMLPCYQIICEECFKDFQRTLDTTASTHFTCPYCDQSLRVSFFELTKDGLEGAEEAKARAREDPKHAKIMGRYGGPHTKTKALLAALEQSSRESEALPSGEQPIKSVVFSGWTTHLDLIQIALEDHKIKYARLDGKMGRKQRAAALDAFRDDPSLTVFLISIGAGGLGLNLTSGSRVYVMEPQFNPAAEAQAVDRVHRLGQKREVKITRFIMEGSFEEKMLALQKKKQNLADLSMNRGKLDKSEAAKQRLEELRSLFK